jgi:hypothetical protein
MNEILNALNLQLLGAESPPGISLKEGQSPGANGFAAMLSQLGQAIPVIDLPGMMVAGSKANSPAARRRAAVANSWDRQVNSKR